MQVWAPEEMAPGSSSTPRRPSIGGIFQNGLFLKQIPPPPENQTNNEMDPIRCHNKFSSSRKEHKFVSVIIAVNNCC